MMTSFLFQLTLLLGFIVLHARNESSGKHAIFPCLNTLPANQMKNATYLQRIFCIGSTNAEQRACQPKGVSQGETANKCVDVTSGIVSKWFMDSFAPFLTTTVGKVIVVLLYLAYLAAAIYGCTQIKEGLEPVNLLVEDSYAAKFYAKLQSNFWSYGMPIQVAFNNPGDVSNSQTRFRIIDAVKAFAESSHGIGTAGLQFWLLDFDEFLPLHSHLFIDEIDRQQFYDHLRSFFHLFPSKVYEADVTWKGTNGSIEEITAFRLMVGVKNFMTAFQQMETLNDFRGIASQYPDLNITTYNEMWPFIDQYEQVLPNVFQELYSGMICMIGIALLFIPNPLGAVCVTLSMASIDAGVIGYMTMWGLSIDCITMITLIMSIGFSVDFSAHIAYSYALNEDRGTKHSIRMALGNLGWPIVQGGLSTVLGVVVLADVKSYMFVAFCKTVVLIIAVGVIHGIVFLPVLISLATHKRQKSQRRCNEQSTDAIENGKSTEHIPPTTQINGKNCVG
uniref:SSD domain-containing protein n=1 Tax=Trichuris muris TaxID=70415 RepID=A0A5S6PZT5_TRIMR